MDKPDLSMNVAVVREIFLLLTYVWRYTSFYVDCWGTCIAT